MTDPKMLEAARAWINENRAKEALAISDWIGQAEAYGEKHLPNLLATFASEQVRERTRWIPVTERRPEVGQTVLVWHEYSETHPSVWEWHENDMERNGPLFWQPLPDPPMVNVTEGEG